VAVENREEETSGNSWQNLHNIHLEKSKALGGKKIPDLKLMLL